MTNVACDTDGWRPTEEDDDGFHSDLADTMLVRLNTVAKRTQTFYAKKKKKKNML